MPEFSSVFSVMKGDRTLTNDELVRAIRFDIAAEYEAVQLYTQLAESTNNELAIKVLLDVAREELVHAGEFLKLLSRLAPEEMSAYEEGYKEVEEMMEDLNKK
jgi:rubrerythrin